MRPCVFAPLLVLALVVGQGIAVIGSCYLDCMDTYGARFSIEYIADRLPWGKP